MKKLILTLLIISPLGLKAHELIPQLKPFENLIGSTWVSDADFFKQEITFKTSLDGKIIIAETKSVIDGKWTDRNHGVRMYDPKADTVKFWEFDRFGGITEGYMTFTDSSMSYHYHYHGYNLVDIWTKIDEDTYDFKTIEPEKDKIHILAKFVRKEDK